MKCHFTSKAPHFTNETIVVGIFKNKVLTEQAQSLDKMMNGGLTNLISRCGFDAENGKTFSVVHPRDIDATHLVLLGLGERSECSALSLEEAGGDLYSHLSQEKISSAFVLLGSENSQNLASGSMAAHLAQGALLKSFHFGKYFTKKDDSSEKKLSELTAYLSSENEVHKAQSLFERLKAIAEGVFYTRTVTSEPPNVLTPETFSKDIENFTKLGIKVETLTKAQMEKLGMGALLGVAQGSIIDPKMVIMEWNGTSEKDAQPLAFIGKGVTFDSGGLSLKSADGMMTMKYDMGGAGIVAGLLKSLALRKAPVRVIGVVGLVENMPSGSAQRPGDVVTSLSKQTIEVLNTDAEGRLVLADVLWYTQDRFKPKFMIDLATLTGAIVIALGDEYAGLFSNSDLLSQQLLEAGMEVNEKVWRFPFHKNFDKQMKSSIADMQNIGGGREAGSITAAMFLQRFVNDVPWAHLDVAGVVWANKERSLCEKGATGYGVRLLNQFITDFYEK